jgi:hypothetical protein
MSKQADPNEPVELWMDSSILSLAAGYPLYRAAEQALLAKARYVFAIEAARVTGLLSGLSFASVVRGPA